MYLVTQPCPTLCDPLDCSLPGSSEFLGKSTRMGCHFAPQGDLPDLGIKPVSPVLQMDSLAAEP